MKIYEEKSLQSFKFWGGAVDRVQCLTPKELDTIEENLIEIFPEGMKDTEVNDFIWFEDETLADWLGFDSFEEIMFRDEEEEEEE